MLAEDQLIYNPPQKRLWKMDKCNYLAGYNFDIRRTASKAFFSSLI